jgi:hypothetical protein
MPHNLVGQLYGNRPLLSSNGHVISKNAGDVLCEQSQYLATINNKNEKTVHPSMRIFYVCTFNRISCIVVLLPYYDYTAYCLYYTTIVHTCTIHV